MDKVQNHVKAGACGCGPPPEQCVRDDEVLTQYGQLRSPFRGQPRVERELGISVLRSVNSLEEATRHVLRREPTDSDLRKSRIRRTTAAVLRAAGFAVVHTPGRVLHSPHCTIVWPDADPIETPQVPWPAEVSERFEECFNDKGGEGEADEP